MNVTAPELGFLEGNNGHPVWYVLRQYVSPTFSCNKNNTNNKLHENTKHDIPLWLARPLARNSFAQLDLPPFYGPKFAADIHASGKAVPVGGFCKYFYRFGEKYCALYDGSSSQFYV